MLRVAPRNLFDTAVSLLKAVGVDRAIGFTVLGKAWLSIAGIVSLVFVGRFLSPAEQGYYYTFASLLALQVFAELGLTNVIMQFASHERAFLELTSQGTLQGSSQAKSRLASLFRLAVRWYGVAALLFAAGLLVAGFAFFTRCAGSHAEVAWRLPWVWTVLAAAGILLVLPVLAFLEGCGFVAEVARFRVFQSLAANAALWIALVGGAGLAAAAIFATTSLIVAVIWLATRWRTLLLDLLLAVRGGAIDWRHEVWPYQWRIAISWLCGYFTFQLFTPLLFAFHGPVEAGRMGMAIGMVAAIASIGTSWLTTKAPRFGVLVARRQFHDLDRVFFRSLEQATGVAILVACSIVGVVVALHVFGHPLADRVLGVAPLSLLAIATVLRVIVTAEAIYLRAFKREPFMPISLVSALLVGTSLWYFAKFHGAMEMLIAYCAINLIVGLGIGTWVFCRKRRLWHQEFASCV